jgi:hypothetical protein
MRDEALGTASAAGGDRDGEPAGMMPHPADRSLAREGRAKHESRILQRGEVAWPGGNRRCAAFRVDDNKCAGTVPCSR